MHEQPLAWLDRPEPCGCGSDSLLRFAGSIRCTQCNAFAPSREAWNAGYRENTKPRRARH